MRIKRAHAIFFSIVILVNSLSINSYASEYNGDVIDEIGVEMENDNTSISDNSVSENEEKTNIETLYQDKEDILTDINQDFTVITTPGDKEEEDVAQEVIAGEVTGIITVHKDNYIFPYNVEDFGAVLYQGVDKGISYSIYEDGTLYLTGYGAIPSFDYWYSGTVVRFTNPAWMRYYYEWKVNISRIIIGEGITGINMCFCYWVHTTTAQTAANNVIGLTVDEIYLPSTLEYLGENAFDGIGVDTLYIPEHVKKIGNDALPSISKALYMENGVEEVGDFFASCFWRLEVAILPDTIKKIGNRCFDGVGARWLKYVHLPESLQSAGNYMFNQCNRLTQIPKWPKGYNEIPDMAFHWCTGLVDVVIPEGVERIGEAAFYENVNLKSVICPSTLKYIEAKAFEGAMDLEYIELNEGLVSLGENSFKSTNIHILRIPGTVETIHGAINHIGYCGDDRPVEGLKKVIFENGPADLTIYSDDFWYDSNLETIVAKKKFRLINGVVYGSEYYLPTNVFTVYAYSGTDLDRIDSQIIIDHGRCGNDCDYVVCSDGRLLIDGTGEMYDFANENGVPWKDVADEIKKVDIADGINSIGCYAFAGCNNLNKVHIPDSICTVGDGAFKDCFSLKDISFSERIIQIGKNVFEGCENMNVQCAYGSNAAIYISENYPQFTLGYNNSVKAGNDISWSIDERGTLVLFGKGEMYDFERGKAPWYYLAEDICKVKIDEDISSVGNYAFYGLINVEEIDNLENIYYVGKNSFYNCGKIKSLIFENVIDIDSNAFSYCKELNELSLPESLKNFAISCVNGCKKLEIVKLPDSITNVFEYENYNNPHVIFGIYADFKLRSEFDIYGINYKALDDIEYEFIYYLNGGINSENNPVTCRIGQEIILTEPCKFGYTFEGWFYDGLLTVAAPDTFLFFEGCAVYAKWKPTVYSISYDLAGGDCEENPKNYTIESDNIILVSPRKVNAIFDGWFDQQGNKVEKICKGSTGNILLTARWIEDCYYVSFLANGGVGTMEKQSVPLNGEIALKLNSFKRKGYAFNGWNTKSDGTGTSYWDGEVISKLCKVKNATVNLYAQWALDTYSIIYGLNDGVQNCKNKYSYNVNKSIKLYNPSRLGYTFRGWYRNPELTGAKVTSISKGTAGDVYLYAMWAENNYKIIFSLNGSNVSGTVCNITTTYSSDVLLPAEESISRKGYTLIGWNTKASGQGMTYEAGECVSELVTQDNGSIVLYAHWKADDYNICYYNADEANNTKNPDVYNTTQKITLKAPSWTGYTFKGWYATEELTGSKVTTIKKGSTDDKDLYASWAENSYKLKFNKNYGSVIEGFPATAVYLFTDLVTLPEDIVTRSGYWLSGWNTKANGKGTHYDLGDTVSGINAENGKTTTLYAEWTPIRYDLNYELNGGINSPKNQNYHTSVADLLLKNPDRLGYTFKGWYTSSTFALSSKVSKIVKSDQPVTVYAKWKANTYSVDFNKNGGKGFMPTVTMTYDVSRALPDNKFTKAGSTFVGWNTKANGTGTFYGNGESVENITSTNGKVITLYAIWE